MIEVLIYSALYLLLFSFTDLLYHRFKVDANHTRKIVHICTGLIALTFPVYLEHLWQVAWLCLSFLLLMAVSERFKWFKSITAVERKSYGSWLFALVVLACFYIQINEGRTEFFYLPILVLTMSDPMAAIVGKRLEYKPLNVFGHKKTLGGSLAFLCSALLILAVVNYFFYNLNTSAILALAGAATVSELLSTKGLDNLTVPGSIVVLLTLFI
jgi:phytol kinase